MTYTHRNGETDPPTEQGYFFFKGHRYSADEDGEMTEEIEPVEGAVYFKTEHAPLFLMDTMTKSDIFAWNYYGQWWGPVTPPWESQP